MTSKSVLASIPYTDTQPQGRAPGSHRTDTSYFQEPAMLTTFPQLLLKHAAERPTAPALREKEYGIWQTHSWADLVRLVEQVAAGLHLAGLQRHEHMVVIGANRPRLYATMLAAQSLGAIPVPLYQDAVGAECVFPLNNAEVRFCLVEDQEQVDKLLEIREQCPQISNIYFDDPRGLRKARCRRRQARQQRRSACLPAPGLDRPEHLQLRPVAGLRLRGQLPRVGQHGDHRPEGSGPHLLLCAAAHF